MLKGSEMLVQHGCCDCVLRGFEVVAIANDNRGTNQKKETGGDQPSGAAAGASPLFQRQSPESGEDNNGRHVQGPTGEVVFAHLGLAHGIEEELEVPDDSGHSGEGIVGNQGFGGETVIGRGVERIEVDKGVAGGVRGAHGVGAGRAEELLEGTVLDDENGGPDEVGEEASPKNDDENGKVLPKVEAVIGEKHCFGDVADGLAGGEAEGEETAHNAGKDGDRDALGEGEVRLARFGLLFGSGLLLFRPACGSIDGYGDNADSDAEQDNLAGGLVHDRGDLAGIDGRDQSAEGSAETKGDGITEGDAKIADGKAEGEAADAPERAEEKSVEAVGRMCGVGGVEDVGQVGDEDVGEDYRCDDPGGEALNEPVNLPRPAFDGAEGNKVGGGGEAADPVINDADKRIGTHAGLVDGAMIVTVLCRVLSYLTGFALGKYTLY